MKRSLAVILILLSALFSKAQTERIADLKLAIHAATDPIKRFDNMLQLLEEHESIYKDSLPVYAREAFILAKQLNSKKAIVNAGIARINNFYRHDMLDSADRLTDSLLTLVDSNKLSEQDMYVQLALQKVNGYASSTNYEVATRLVFKVLAIAERIKDTVAQAKCMNTLAVFAYNMNKLDDDILWCRRVQALCRNKERFLRVQAYNYINLATHFAWKEQYDSANLYVNAAITTSERLQNLYYLANAYLWVCNIHKWNGDMPGAEQAMLKAMDYRRKTEGNLIFSNEQLALANLYVSEKQYQKAIDLYTQGISYAYDSIKARGNAFDYDILQYYYVGLARSYQATGNHDLYENALEHIITLKDTLTQLNSARAIADMQTKYEVQLKDNTIIRQKLDITQKNVLFYGSLIVLALSLIIAWLLFRNYSRRQKMQFYLAREEEQRKAAWAVKEAQEKERKRIAADLHDNMGSYAASIKANVEELMSQIQTTAPAINSLNENSQQMVALLGDTIWALNKEELSLSAISDRIKVFLQRLRKNYPQIEFNVDERITNDIKLPPVHAYNLFMIVQEAVNNAVRHSRGTEIQVSVVSERNWSIAVTDNGIGMGNSSGTTDGGNGSHNMRTRAAEAGWQLSWEPITPTGTKVLVSNTN
ncbi:MAG: tetratricopeptide repeat-containing sensor histidine kinase [Flavipsychrobacter sp.]